MIYETSFKATAICLSYRRPDNIPRVLSGILASTCIERVIVCNNNPDVALKNLPLDTRIHVINQKVHMPAAHRFFLASELEGEYFVSIDDDLFLSGNQVDQLVSFVAKYPEVPHGGPWGQKLVTIENCSRLQGWLYPDDEVDVLNRAYAFSREHAKKFVALCSILGASNALESGPWDDVVISHSGAGRPKTHHLGDWQSCPSSNDASVALWMQPGFHDSRLRIFNQLRKNSAKGL